jgi:formylglycine-generating enzyme required for sulfatase activity
VEEPVCDWQADGYRLPTEAEWEYASRGGVGRWSPFYWGEDWQWDYGWLGDGDNAHYYGWGNDAGGRFAERGNANEKPHPVGQKIGNQFGLYDVVGNVYQLCWDWVGPYHLQMKDLRDPKGPPSREQARYGGGKEANYPCSENFGGRCMKGGYYGTLFGLKGFSGQHERFSITPDERRKTVGFRVATRTKDKHSSETLPAKAK